MSFSHEAFVFDWVRFQVELGPLLFRCLESADARSLIEFVNLHRDSLVDPYEGEPLAEDWEENLENGDEQEVGDFALTLYYDPTANFGLGKKWSQLESGLTDGGREALLGAPFGLQEKLFDPGRMGAYFQSPEAVMESLAGLRRISNPDLAEYLHRLESALDHGMGIYVTF